MPSVCLLYSRSETHPVAASVFSGSVLNPTWILLPAGPRQELSAHATAVLKGSELLHLGCWTRCLADGGDADAGCIWVHGVALLNRFSAAHLFLQRQNAPVLGPACWSCMICLRHTCHWSTG